MRGRVGRNQAEGRRGRVRPTRSGQRSKIKSSAPAASAAKNPCFEDQPPKHSKKIGWPSASRRSQEGWPPATRKTIKSSAPLCRYLWSDRSPGVASCDLRTCSVGFLVSSPPGKVTETAPGVEHSCAPGGVARSKVPMKCLGAKMSVFRGRGKCWQVFQRPKKGEKNENYHEICKKKRRNRTSNCSVALKEVSRSVS